MPRINLLRIQTGDNQTSIVEKVNYNFDQILSAGGGPQGVQGDIGPTGPIGPQGPIGLPGIVGAAGSRWFVQGTTAPVNPQTILGNNPNQAPNIGDYWFDTDTNDQRIYVFGATASWVYTGYGFGQSDIFAYYANTRVGGPNGATFSSVLLNDAPTSKNQNSAALILSDLNNGTTGYSLNSGVITGGNTNINNEQAKLKIATHSTTSIFSHLISFGKADLEVTAGGQGIAFSNNNNPTISWDVANSYNLTIKSPSHKIALVTGNTGATASSLTLNSMKDDVIFLSNTTAAASDKGFIFKGAPPASGGFWQYGTGDIKGTSTTLFSLADRGLSILGTPSYTGANPLYVNPANGTGGIAVGDINFQNTPAPTGGAIIEGNVIIGATGDRVFPASVPDMPAGAGATPQPDLTISRKSTGKVFEFRQDSTQTIPTTTQQQPPASTNARIYYGDRDSTNGVTTNFGPSNLVQEFNASGSISGNVTDASALSYIHRYANASGSNGSDVFSITTRWAQTILPILTVLKTENSVRNLVFDTSPTTAGTEDGIVIKHQGATFARFYGTAAGNVGSNSLHIFNPARLPNSGVSFYNPVGGSSLSVSKGNTGAIIELRQDKDGSNNNDTYGSRTLIGDFWSDVASGTAANTSTLGYTNIIQEVKTGFAGILRGPQLQHRTVGSTGPLATPVPVFSLYTNLSGATADGTWLRTDATNNKILLHVNPTSPGVGDQIGILHRGATFAEFNGILGGTSVTGSGRYSLTLFEPSVTSGTPNVVRFNSYGPDGSGQLSLGAPKLMVSAGGRGEIAEFRQDINTTSAGLTYNSRITFNDRNSTGAPNFSYTSINQEAVDIRTSPTVNEAFGYHHKWSGASGATAAPVFSIITTKTQPSLGPDSTIIGTTGSNGRLVLRVTPDSPNSADGVYINSPVGTYAYFSSRLIPDQGNPAFNGVGANSLRLTDFNQSYIGPTGSNRLNKLLVEGSTNYIAEFRGKYQGYSSAITIDTLNSGNSQGASISSLSQIAVRGGAPASAEAIGYYQKYSNATGAAASSVFSITYNESSPATMIRTHNANNILYINCAPSSPLNSDSLQLQVNNQTNVSLQGTAASGTEAASMKVTSRRQAGTGSGIVIGEGGGNASPANSTFGVFTGANTHSLLKLNKSSGSNSNNGIHIQNSTSQGNPALIVTNGNSPRVIVDGSGNLGIYGASTTVPPTVNANLDVYGTVSIIPFRIDSFNDPINQYLRFDPVSTVFAGGQLNCAFSASSTISNSNLGALPLRLISNSIPGTNATTYVNNPPLLTYNGYIGTNTDPGNILLKIGPFNSDVSFRFRTSPNLLASSNFGGPLDLTVFAGRADSFNYDVIDYFYEEITPYQTLPANYLLSTTPANYGRILTLFTRIKGEYIIAKGSFITIRVSQNPRGVSGVEDKTNAWFSFSFYIQQLGK
jgi:hypothetical protein